MHNRSEDLQSTDTSVCLVINTSKIMKIFKSFAIVLGAIAFVSLGFLVGSYQPHRQSAVEAPKAETINAGSNLNFKIVGEPPNVKFVPQVPEGDVIGAYLKAFVIAYEDFKKIPDLPIHKKQLTNYTIGMRTSSDGKNYYITFTPIYTPPKNGIVDVERDSEMGRLVGYTIRVKDFTLVRRSYSM